MNPFRKLIALFLATCMLVSLIACGASASKDPNTNSGETKSVADTTEEDLNALSGIGETEVENGIVFVKITLSQDFVGTDITQEEIDAKAGESYTSGKLNPDGSVTYKMTHSQYNSMLSEMSAAVDEGIQELVDEETLSIESVSHNAKYTQFDVTLSTTTLGFSDMFTAYVFYLYGGMMGIMTGERGADIVVNYYDPAGNLIESGHSANMGT